MDLDALLLTLRLALSTTTILLGVALPLAWWIASRRGVAQAAVQAVVSLPLVLPPTVIGFYLLVALGPLTPFGRLYIRLAGHPLAFSFAGLLAGSIVYSLPFAVQPLVSGFGGLDPGFLEASAALGVRPLKTLLGVVLPMIRGPILTAAVLTFTHTVGEFGVVLMIGGNIPGRTRTLSIALFDQVQEFDYAGANRTALLLLVIAAAALLAIYLWPALGRNRRGDLLA